MDGGFASGLVWRLDGGIDGWVGVGVDDRVGGVGGGGDWFGGVVGGGSVVGGLWRCLNGLE